MNAVSPVMAPAKIKPTKATDAGHTSQTAPDATNRNASHAILKNTPETISSRQNRKTVYVMAFTPAPLFTVNLTAGKIFTISDNARFGLDDCIVGRV